MQSNLYRASLNHQVIYRVVTKDGPESFKFNLCICVPAMFEYQNYLGDDEGYYDHNIDGESEDLPFEMDPFSGGESDVTINIHDFKSSVWQRLFQHYVCALGSSEKPAKALLTEAELHMLSYDYRQALICALAAGSVDDSNDVQLRRAMIQTICLYQLGDRTSACALKEEIGEAFDQELISVYLLKRYSGTCEVLSFMPDFLGLLRGMKKQRDSDD